MCLHTGGRESPSCSKSSLSPKSTSAIFPLRWSSEVKVSTLSFDWTFLGHLTGKQMVSSGTFVAAQCLQVTNYKEAFKTTVQFCWPENLSYISWCRQSFYVSPKMSDCATICLNLPQWDGGSRKIRFIYLVDHTSFRLTECPDKVSVAC